MATEILYTIHVYVLFLLLTFRFSSSFIGNGENYRRNVSLELNPGLNSLLTPLPPGVGLLHVRALGKNNTLHYLLCSQGAPALLLVHTSSISSKVEVDWPAFLMQNTTGSLKVTPESSVLYSNALVFTRLWEYDDVNDTADPEHLPPSSFFQPYELQNFSWGDLNKTLDPTGHTALLCGRDASKSFSNGSLCLKFSAFDVEGRDQGWPSLLHNANSSQLRVGLDGVAPRSNRSRFSLELQAVGDTQPMSRVDMLRSIDDEYTPSIFKVSQWVSSPVNSTSPVLGYAQWKPVAYRRPSPAFEDATPCRHSTPVPVAQLPPSGLVRAYFGGEHQTTGLNMTFSITGDPFYNTTNYLSWTVLVGLGSPPVDLFSPLVLVIMVVGLGTPMLIILLGGVCVCVRKNRPQTQVYEPIQAKPLTIF
ncbi:glycosylated lysosomal membrane protein-like [Oncorhynchus masou masou]|uniref:glycosylated lysosomal membrane protein-like n=1 Tax=Oncorhynchus masou masou TaxID=90313 RepID=UPI0031838050